MSAKVNEAFAHKIYPLAPPADHAPDDRQAAVGPSGGLCATCDNGPGCTFTRSAAAVWGCEELDYPPRPVEKQARPPQKTGPGEAAGRPALGPEADRENLIGLCSTCQNLATCVFKKPEGGVWNCEEFV